MNIYDILYKYAKEDGKYVYHMKSKEFKGDKILSLNKIKETNPKVYKKSILKYKNR